MALTYSSMLDLQTDLIEFDLLNLRKYVNDKLLRLNVKVDNINKDTFREKSNFFSYRRSQKLSQNDYGRCISVISMTKFSQN